MALAGLAQFRQVVHYFTQGPDFGLGAETPEEFKTPAANQWVLKGQRVVLFVLPGREETQLGVAVEEIFNHKEGIQCHGPPVGGAQDGAGSGLAPRGTRSGGWGDRFVAEGARQVKR